MSIRRSLINGYAKPLFDDCGAIYSLRKLCTTYNGYCIKVRRSSDNTEMNIGYTNNILDIPTLLNFTGNSSGYISTWYDSSGNGNDALQPNSSSQPRIVNEGVLETVEGKPALNFMGEQFLSAGDANDIGDQSFALFVVGEAKGKTNNEGAALVSKSLTAYAPGRYALIKISTEENTFQFLLQTESEGGGAPFDGANVRTEWIGRKLFSMITRRDSNNYTYINNLLIRNKSLTIPNYNLNTTNRFLIGAYNDSTDIDQRGYNNAPIQEIILYHKDTWSIKSLIMNNINKYYSIY